MTDAAPAPTAAIAPIAARPPVPVFAVLVTVAAGLALLGSTFVGAAALSVARKFDGKIPESARRRQARALDRKRLDDAKASLDAVAARVEATSRGAAELPETLGVTPPNDPWGRPIDYLRVTPDRAVIRSPGPDGRLGTKDDVRREVELK